MLIAHRQLVSLVQMKTLRLTSSDFNIITNIIECNKANLVEAENWVSIFV